MNKFRVYFLFAFIQNQKCKYSIKNKFKLKNLHANNAFI